MAQILGKIAFRGPQLCQRLELVDCWKVCRYMFAIMILTVALCSKLYSRSDFSWPAESEHDIGEHFFWPSSSSGVIHC